MAKCPKCTDERLLPTQIAEQLVVSGCNSCHGGLLNLLTYRVWREADHAERNAGIPPLTVTPDSQHVLLCPKCSGLMTKYHFDDERPNRLDYCARCEEVWLDDGEWEVLEALTISDHLTEVFSRPWQYKIRLQKQRSASDASWRERLGSDYEKAMEARNWLENSKNRRELVAFLSGPNGVQ